MKSKMKKILAVLLIMCMIIPSIPARIAGAAEGETEKTVDEFVTVANQTIAVNFGSNACGNSTIKAKMENGGLFVFYTKVKLSLEDTNVTTDMIFTGKDSGNSQYENLYFEFRHDEDGWYFQVESNNQYGNNSQWKAKRVNLSDAQCNKIKNEGLDLYLVKNGTCLYDIYIEDSELNEVEFLYQWKSKAVDIASIYQVNNKRADVVTTGYFYQGYTAEEVVNYLWNARVTPSVDDQANLTVTGLKESYSLGDTAEFSLSHKAGHVDTVTVAGETITSNEKGKYQFLIKEKHIDNCDIVISTLAPTFTFLEHTNGGKIQLIGSGNTGNFGENTGNFLFHTKLKCEYLMNQQGEVQYPETETTYAQIKYSGWSKNPNSWVGYYIKLVLDSETAKLTFTGGSDNGLTPVNLDEAQIMKIANDGLDIFFVHSADNDTVFDMYVEQGDTEKLVDTDQNITINDNKQTYEVAHEKIYEGTTIVTTGYSYTEYATTQTAAEMFSELTAKELKIEVTKDEHLSVEGLDSICHVGDYLCFETTAEDGYAVQEVKINNVVVTPQEDGTYKYCVTIADIDGITIEVNESAKDIDEFIDLPGMVAFDTNFGGTSYNNGTISSFMKDGMLFVYHTKVKNALDSTGGYGPQIKYSGYGNNWEDFYINIRKTGDTKWYFNTESCRQGASWISEINKRYLTDAQLNAIKGNGLDLYFVRTGVASYAVYLGNDDLTGVELVGSFTSDEVKTNEIFQIKQTRTDGVILGYFYQGYTAKEAVELLWNTKVTLTTNVENAKIEGTKSTYTLGEKVSFTAIAGDGYAVTSVTLNGKELPQDENGTYSFIVKKEHTTGCNIVVMAKETSITEYKTLNEFSSNNTKNKFDDSTATKDSNYVLHSKIKMTNAELESLKQNDQGINVICEGYGSCWVRYTLSLKYTSNKWTLNVSSVNEKTWNIKDKNYELASEQIEAITDDGLDLFVTHKMAETQFDVYVEKGETVERVYTIVSEVGNGKIYSIAHSNATMITSSLYFYGEGFTQGNQVSNVLLKEEIKVQSGELQNANIHGLKDIYHAGDKVSFSVKPNVNYVVTSVTFNGDVLTADTEGVYHYYLTYSNVNDCNVSIATAQVTSEEFVECIGTSSIDMGDRYNPFVFHITIKGDTVYDDNGAVINYGGKEPDSNAYAKVDFAGYGTQVETLSVRLFVTEKDTSFFQLGAWYNSWKEDISDPISAEQLHKITTSGLNLFLVSTAGSPDSTGITPLTVALYVENANSSGVTKACELTMQHATRLYSVKHTTKTGATLETTGSTYTADSSENVAEALFEQAYFIKGDSNDDGVFDVRDLIRTKRYQEKATAKIHVQCADMDENNLITDNDVLLSREVLVNEAEAEAIAYYDGLASRSGDSHKIMNTSLFYRNNRWDRDRTGVYGADPYVMEITEDGDTNQGKFLMLVTAYNKNNTIPVYISSDLVNWKEKADAIRIVKSDGTSVGDFYKNVDKVWAMEMIYDEGKDKYYLFFSIQQIEDDKEIQHVPYVAVGNSYIGTFTLIDHYNEYKYASGSAMNSSEGSDALGYASRLRYSLFDPYELGKTLKDKGIVSNPSSKPISAIDFHPYVDGDTKYLYFSLTSADKGQVIVGMKMTDWVTPDYTSLTVLTKNKSTTVSGNTNPNYERNNVNEGPWITKHGDKYYLTLSINDYNLDNYKVIQAVSENGPLGPFCKLTADEGGILIGADRIGEISGPGHHSLIEKDGELYIVYHAIHNYGTDDAERYILMNKVEWVTNSNGLEVMYVNGPTRTSIQPLPGFATGYNNIAPTATITANGNEVTGLNDKVWNSKGSTWRGENSGIDTFFGDAVAKDVEFNGETTITMNFAEAQTIRALMIYNSSDVNKAFDEIERIEFVCADGSKKYINHLGFDFTANTYTLAKYQGKTDGDEKFINGASVAEFNEMKVKEIRITVKPGAGKSSVALGEIVVLGKN